MLPLAVLIERTEGRQDLEGRRPLVARREKKRETTWLAMCLVTLQLFGCSSSFDAPPLLPNLSLHPTTTSSSDQPPPPPNLTLDTDLYLCLMLIWILLLLQVLLLFLFFLHAGACGSKVVFIISASTHN